FSSRRRHTRSYGGWSSDVCSSDLGAPDVFTHAPVLLPPTPGVTLRRVGQLLVRKHHALQSQEDAQPTGKGIGLDGHASSLFRSTKVRKWSGSRRFCTSR